MSTRVLVVEDDLAGREALAALLRFWGYAVDEAETGGRAMEMASRCPAIVVVDLGLPDMKGDEVVAALKALPAPPFVVVYTGFHQLEAGARAAGCDAFVLKPAIDALRTLLATAPRVPARKNKVSVDGG